MSIDWFPLTLSLRVAACATAISFMLGLGLAYVLANKRFRGRELLDAVITLPLVLPPTVLGYYLLVMLGRSAPVGRLYEVLFGGPLVFTWQAAVIASTVHAVPMLVKQSRAALETVGREYERAARILGASEWRVFWRVTLPLAWRSILAATVLAFARSLGDFGTTLMIAGDIPKRTQTASVAIYDAVESGNKELALVLVLAISAITIAIVFASNRFARKAI